MTSRHEKEPELSALAALWRTGKISTDELSRHLKRRQLPLFPGLEKKYLPLFTPAEQEQLTLFLTAEQRQLTLSLLAEVNDELAGNELPTRTSRRSQSTSRSTSE